MTKNDRVREAIETVLHFAKGTEIDPEDFNFKKGFAGLSYMCTTRRAFAHGRGLTKLAAAIDNLIKEIER